MEGGINRQKTVQAAFFWGWLVGSLCTSRFCYSTLFAFLAVGTVSSLAWFSGLVCSSSYLSVARMYSEAPFYLLCPRFTVPEYYCSRARLRPRLASSQSGTDPALLTAARRIASQAQIQTVQCSCGRPRLCLYKLVGTQGRWQYLLLVPLLYRTGQTDSACTPCIPRHSPVHMACSERLRHGAASSKAGWPKHSAVQLSYSTCTAVSAQPWASSRSPAPASTLTPTPRVRHAAQAVQLESYLDYGASRSAEVGVRPKQLAARGPPASGTGTGTGTVYSARYY